ncbi:hypothetical protein BDK62_12424 [Halomonas alkaliantarctica]|nr:hypothetical protein BDK62_12424 [Halomonas alkaliantarctica]
MTVINLNYRRPKIAFRYQDGDICRALRLALEHNETSADIEQALRALMFERTEDSADETRDVIFSLLETAQ